MTTKTIQANQNDRKTLISRTTAVKAVAIVVLMFGMFTAGCQQVEKVQPKPSIGIGTWIESKKIAEKDGAFHPMQYRIDSIIRDQAIVAAAISNYNLSGTGNLIGELTDKNLEFCMAEYSATYPEEFPQGVFGITDVAIPFEIVSMTGGTIQVENTIYQNLETTWEIGSLPQGYDFHAGDTYQGRIIYIMVKGYSEYLIHEIKTDAGEGGEVYIKGI
jgi:hypothetical protein